MTPSRWRVVHDVPEGCQVWTSMNSLRSTRVTVIRADLRHRSSSCTSSTSLSLCFLFKDVLAVKWHEKAIVTRKDCSAIVPLSGTAVDHGLGGCTTEVLFVVSKGF